MTDPNTIRDELSRTLALQKEIADKIPAIISETNVLPSAIAFGEGGSDAADAAADGGGGAPRPTLGPLVADLQGLSRQTDKLSAELAVTSREAEKVLSCKRCVPC